MPFQNPQIATWNRRYADSEQTPLAAPSAPLRHAVANVTPGRALDLACGLGRHAIWLAANGWHVDAVDGSHVAIAQLMSDSQSTGCHEWITPTLTDLEAEPPTFIITENHYDLILDFFFLHRPLFEAIRIGIRPGGLFVAALHIPLLSSPSEPAQTNQPHKYLLEPRELERTVASWKWKILHSLERAASTQDQGYAVAELVARKPNR